MGPSSSALRLFPRATGPQPGPACGRARPSPGTQRGLPSLRGRCSRPSWDHIWSQARRQPAEDHVATATARLPGLPARRVCLVGWEAGDTAGLGQRAQALGSVPTGNASPDSRGASGRPGTGTGTGTVLCGGGGGLRHRKNQVGRVRRWLGDRSVQGAPHACACCGVTRLLLPGGALTSLHGCGSPGSERSMTRPQSHRREAAEMESPGAEHRQLLSPTDLNPNPGSRPPRCVTLNKLLYLSEPQFI